MTLASGHPIVIIDGTPFDGDADCGDDGLRAYLKTIFGLSEDVIEECNGSQLVLRESAFEVVAGQKVSGKFYLSWCGSPDHPIQEAIFTLSGVVELDEGETVLRVLPTDIKQVPEKL